MRYNETADSTIFELWFEGRFSPNLPKDAVIVVDNASFHRKAELRKLDCYSFLWFPYVILLVQN